MTQKKFNDCKEYVTNCINLYVAEEYRERCYKELEENMISIKEFMESDCIGVNFVYGYVASMIAKYMEDNYKGVRRDGEFITKV